MGRSTPRGATMALGLLCLAGVSAPASAKLPPIPVVKTLVCQLGTGKCPLLSPWHHILTVELAYSFAFTASAYVVADVAGQPRQCVIDYSQHVDMSGKGDLGFFPFKATVAVTTVPKGFGSPSGTEILLANSVAQKITDKAFFGKFRGSGSVPIQNIIDIKGGKTPGNEQCVPGFPTKSSINGTVTIAYVEGKPLTVPKIPKLPPLPK